MIAPFFLFFVFSCSFGLVCHKDLFQKYDCSFDFCSSLQYSIENLTFHAGWNDRFGGEPDPQVWIIFKDIGRWTFWEWNTRDFSTDEVFSGQMTDIYVNGSLINVNGSDKFRITADISEKEFWDIIFEDEVIFNSSLYFDFDDCISTADNVRYCGRRIHDGGNWRLEFDMKVFCKLIQCSSRTTDSSTACQSKYEKNPCYKDSDTNCTNDCGTDRVPLEGRCVSICDLRTPAFNEGLFNPCKEDTCYLRTENGIFSCASVCPPDHEIENHTYRRCDLKSCVDRLSNASAPYPCGVNCYQQMRYGRYVNYCGLDCPSAHTIADNTTGRCVFKDCDQRVYSSSADYPCGELNCYQQMENGRYINSCGLDCPSDHTITDRMTGRCVFKDCDQRVYSSSADYPCGETNCYQQMENGSYINSCGLDCPSVHTIADNTTGRCVFKDCDQRVYSSSADYPCGETNCYQQMEYGSYINSCGLDCPSDYTITDSSTGRCVQKVSVNTRNVKTGVVLVIVVPAIALTVVVILIIAGLLYSKKKKQGRKE